MWRYLHVPVRQYISESASHRGDLGSGGDHNTQSIRKDFTKREIFVRLEDLLEEVDDEW